MSTLEMLAKIQAMPHTHRVVVVFADGQRHDHTTRNAASAKTYADHMTFRFGATACVTVELI